jgi:hypothetical protein
MAEDERLDCGHTTREHTEMDELHGLVTHVTKLANPRVALIITETGEVHFASSIPPGEAALVLEKMAGRVHRYGSNYVKDHFDRGAASEWN